MRVHVSVPTPAAEDAMKGALCCYYCSTLWESSDFKVVMTARNWRGLRPAARPESDHWKEGRRLSA